MLICLDKLILQATSGVLARFHGFGRPGEALHAQCALLPPCVSTEFLCSPGKWWCLGSN